MDFEFAAPGRIVFGPGSISRLPGLAAGLGRTPLVVTGGTPERHAAALAALADAGLPPVTFPVAGEPSVEVAASGAALARENGCDLVVSIGGGGALDAGKAVAALMANTDDIYEYLEVVGKARPLENRPAPHIAAPTTAGTGAEATANAVLTAKAQRVKVSLRSPRMLPTIALVDPLLTLTVPPQVTAATGLDALTQLLEAFTSNKANPLTSALCREGLSRAARSLRRAFDDGSNAAAREDMALASLFSGMALANAKLGAVHGFAAPLGGLFDAPHGQVCASLLPFVVRANIAALGERTPQSPALAAYAEAARILTGKQSATAQDCAAWIEELCASFDTPSLSRLGVTRADIPLVVEKASRASSMKGNPVELTAGELSAILEAALV
ncbi:iron-containing alcohol dehydrogenase [Fundidesulfovibrio terrae]|uniref:iron-containing alcohol dehydrogenase n=1 Tax=Fundidesulfovibrio terrae TaxID=2922866 RepID=UPI001FAFCCE3|nr:iron-containing alcohol dehydrogenase [Fundidesulfovibrio terrae]